MANSRLCSLIVLLLIPLLSLSTSLTYNSHDLHCFWTCNNRVPLTVFHKLKELGICAVKPTRRGRRSWTKQRKRSIPVLTSPCTRPDGAEHFGQHCSNPKNLVHISTDVKHSSCCNFALLNARSIKRKTTMIHDMIINNSIDICAITETWLSGDHRDHHSLADLKNTLPDFQVHHIPRRDRAGGGVLVCLKQSFHVHQHETTECDSFEYIDLSITSSSNTPLRLLVVYRPQRLLNKKSTATLFMQEFSTLLEHIVTESNRILIVQLPH